VGLSVLAFPFVALLTSPDYYEGFKIVGFVVFSSFAWGLASIAMMGLAIKKKAGRLGANQIIAAFVHIGLQLLLVPRFGYVASAISTLIGYTVLLILQATASRPYLKWRFPFKTLRNTFVASGVMGLVAWAIYKISRDVNKASPIYLILSISFAVKDDEKVAALQFWHKVIHRGTRAKNIRGK
jgi:O-antigen/teichoic acid export membrane protein